MTRAAALLMCVSTALLAGGCSDFNFGRPSGPEFIAANSSTVVIDIATDNVADTLAAQQMANDRCTMFGGGRIASLESLNLRNNGRQRATYLCK
jgi:hypothetical protein